MSLIIEFPRKTAPKSRAKKQPVLKTAEQTEAGTNANMLRVWEECKLRAESDVEAAIGRLQTIKETIALLQRKVGAKRTVGSCTVDGRNYEVTFYDGEASVIHKLSQRVRHGTDIVDTLRYQVWGDGAYRGTISKELANRVIAAAR